MERPLCYISNVNCACAEPLSSVPWFTSYGTSAVTRRPGYRYRVFICAKCFSTCLAFNMQKLFFILPSVKQKVDTGEEQGRKFICGLPWSVFPVWSSGDKNITFRELDFPPSWGRKREFRLLDPAHWNRYNCAAATQLRKKTDPTPEMLCSWF